jgi:hypothetical protein
MALAASASKRGRGFVGGNGVEATALIAAVVAAASDDEVARPAATGSSDAREAGSITGEPQV